MNFDPNPLYYKMCKIFAQNKGNPFKTIICNEGGSRSSKTWDTYHFIYTYCDHNRDKNKDIYILRATLKNCRDHTFKDFKKFMRVIGGKAEYFAENQSPYVKLFGNNIYFRGLDDEKNAEGYPSNVVFVNEALETKKSQIDGIKMRCEELMILDWNPKFTDYWCYDLEGQEGVYFTHSTYKNNKHLKDTVIKEIQGFEPWESGTYEVINNEIIYKGKVVTETHQPPPNIKNEKSADTFRWKVYGLGLRGAMKGVIYEQLEWIDSFPENEPYIYANDFGYTNDPNVLIRYAEDENNIYAECLTYQSIPTPEELAETFEALNVEKFLPIACDSSDKISLEKHGTVEMVRGLRSLGYREAFKISKRKSKLFWINSIKSKKLHVVKNHLWKKVKTERENYIFKEINGVFINRPIDGYDHFFDALKYAHIAHNSNRNKSFESYER